MNMAHKRSFALGTKAGNCRTWPVKDADKREGGAASFETKVMVKLKKSVLTLETGSQKEQIFLIYVTFWALLKPGPKTKGPVVPLYRLPWLQRCSCQNDDMIAWVILFLQFNKQNMNQINIYNIYNSSVKEVCVIVLNVH